MFKEATSLLLLLTIALFITSVHCAVIETDDIAEQGLYSKSDKVVILTQRNFKRKVYGQKHALIVQFYNSYCGHCRAFAPKFKSVAGDLVHWRDVVQLAVLDCSIEENNEVCRQFEVMAYPSLRFLHQNYVKGNSNVGEKVSSIESAEQLKTQIIHKLQSEQALLRLPNVPPLDIMSYHSYTSALSDIPNDVIYTFLLFENDNSTVGSELILDTHDYQRIRVKRVRDVSELTAVANVNNFPGLVAVRNTLEATPLTPKTPTKANLLRAINIFLQSKNYEFPARDVDETTVTEPRTHLVVNTEDVVHYSDLEKTLQMALHNEVTRYKVLNGEPLTALKDFIEVILTSFPFQYENTRDYFVELRGTLSRRNEWSGSELYELVKRLEVVHAPVYSTSPKTDYIGCKGSQPHFRGYTCGLWTLFHTLTVNAAQKPGSEGPKVLRAMHGYVKNFFGCTECAEHFQQMAARNRLFDVMENDKAVLWLWISHNEVNLRLAGDVTEDPAFPKLQFPSPERCHECRLARGAWNLPAVLRYLQGMYGAAGVRQATALRSRAAAATPSPFSNLDIGMLSLLYIFSFIILILVVKLFLTKRFYRKKIYKHDGWGKV